MNGRKWTTPLATRALCLLLVAPAIASAQDAGGLVSAETIVLEYEVDPETGEVALEPYPMSLSFARAAGSSDWRGSISVLDEHGEPVIMESDIPADVIVLGYGSFDLAYVSYYALYRGRNAYVQWFLRAGGGISGVMALITVDDDEDGVAEEFVIWHRYPAPEGSVQIAQ